MRGMGAGRPYDPQISEVIPGGDDALWTLGSYRDADGTTPGHASRAASCGSGRRASGPPAPRRRSGTRTSRARGHELLDALEWHGISQVEVKRDPRDGRDYLIEVNPRSWLWISLATGVRREPARRSATVTRGARRRRPVAGHPGAGAGCSASSTCGASVRGDPRRQLVRRGAGVDAPARR